MSAPKTRSSRAAELPSLEEALDSLDSRRPLLPSELRMPAAVAEDNSHGLTMRCARCGQDKESRSFRDPYCRPCRNAYERERYARRKGSLG